MTDCGAGVFIDQNFAKNFEQRKLDRPLTAKNVDGTVNKKGTIENYPAYKLQKKRAIFCFKPLYTIKFFCRSRI